MKPPWRVVFSCLDDDFVRLDLLLEFDVFGFELQVGDGVLGNAVGIPTADVTRGDLEDPG